MRPFEDAVFCGRSFCTPVAPRPAPALRFRSRPSSPLMVDQRTLRSVAAMLFRRASSSSPNWNGLTTSAPAAAGLRPVPPVAAGGRDQDWKRLALRTQPRIRSSRSCPAAEVDHRQVVAADPARASLASGTMSTTSPVCPGVGRRWWRAAALVFHHSLAEVPPMRCMNPGLADQRCPRGAARSFRNRRRPGGTRSCQQVQGAQPAAMRGFHPGAGVGAQVTSSRL